MLILTLHTLDLIAVSLAVESIMLYSESFSVGRGFELIDTRSPSCCELRIDADQIKDT